MARIRAGRATAQASQSSSRPKQGKSKQLSAKEKRKSAPALAANEVYEYTAPSTTKRARARVEERADSNDEQGPAFAGEEDAFKFQIGGEGQDEDMDGMDEELDSDYADTSDGEVQSKKKPVKKTVCTCSLAPALLWC